jgi:hypothetical protein
MRFATLVAGPRPYLARFDQREERGPSTGRDRLRGRVEAGRWLLVELERQAKPVEGRIRRRWERAERDAVEGTQRVELVDRGRRPEAIRIIPADDQQSAWSQAVEAL